MIRCICYTKSLNVKTTDQQMLLLHTFHPHYAKSVPAQDTDMRVKKEADRSFHRKYKTSTVPGGGYLVISKQVEETSGSD